MRIQRYNGFEYSGRITIWGGFLWYSKQDIRPRISFCGGIIYKRRKSNIQEFYYQCYRNNKYHYIIRFFTNTF